MFSSIPMIFGDPGKGLFLVWWRNLGPSCGKCHGRFRRFRETPWHRCRNSGCCREISTVAVNAYRPTQFHGVSAFPISRPVAPLGNGNGKSSATADMALLGIAPGEAPGNRGHRPWCQPQPWKLQGKVLGRLPGKSRRNGGKWA
jgi:hypothetical protein